MRRRTILIADAVRASGNDPDWAVARRTQWEYGRISSTVEVCGLPSVKRFVRKLRGVRSPEARVITLWYYSRVLTVDRKIFDRRSLG